MPYTDEQPYEITLRGLSPQRLLASAERQCAMHFGECPWRVDEQSCLPCMRSLGGRTLLYEAHVVARPLPSERAA